MRGGCIERGEGRVLDERIGQQDADVEKMRLMEGRKKDARRNETDEKQEAVQRKEGTCVMLRSEGRRVGVYGQALLGGGGMRGRDNFSVGG